VDAIVQQAREAHRKASEHTGLSHHYRQQRDDAIRRAYAAGEMSYGRLANQIGCSPELVAKAVQGR
jgi:ribosome-binding protein aMBF1 (putative translation factor)